MTRLGDRSRLTTSGREIEEKQLSGSSHSVCVCVRPKCSLRNRQTNKAIPISEGFRLVEPISEGFRLVEEQPINENASE